MKNLLKYSQRIAIKQNSAFIPQISKRFNIKSSQNVTPISFLNQFQINTQNRFYGAGYPHPTRTQALERILQILSQHENVIGVPTEESTLEELGFSLLDRVEVCS